MPEHILSLSYGKDSLACLFAIEKLGWPLDRIVHAEVWATDTIPADLPPMVEFKAKADAIIKERWGIEVEYFRAEISFEDRFYTKKEKSRQGMIYGWPFTIAGNWCNSDLKMAAMRKAMKSAKNSIQYIGIAADEPNRFHNLSDTKKSPLVEVGWDKAYCRKICEENDLLSPTYTTATRGGCWFCHNQSTGQLRLLRKNYPELWALMLKWDKDSPVTFKPGHWTYKRVEVNNLCGFEDVNWDDYEDGDEYVTIKDKFVEGKTVHDYDLRFQLEDEGYIFPEEKGFKWSMIENPQRRWF